MRRYLTLLKVFFVVQTVILLYKSHLERKSVERVAQSLTYVDVKRLDHIALEPDNVGWVQREGDQRSRLRPRKTYGKGNL